MRLAIVAATGGIGRQLLRQALAAGHEVTAVARSPLTARHERLRAVQADAADAAAVARVVEGQDAVISTVGPSRSTPAGEIISTATRNIISAMKQSERFVLTSGLMVGEARGAGLVQRLGIRAFRLFNLALYRDKLLAERLVRESGLPWVIVRPPVFDGRAPRGTFRMGEDLDVGMASMSAADVAGALLRAATDDSVLRKAVEISY
jgi:putative NADH-flavin reductase